VGHASWLATARASAPDHARAPGEPSPKLYACGSAVAVSCSDAALRRPGGPRHRNHARFGKTSSHRWPV